MACLWILANLSLMIKLVNSFFLTVNFLNSPVILWPYFDQRDQNQNWRSVCSSVCCCSWGLSTRPSVLMGLWVHSVSIPHHLCQIFPWVSRRTLTSRWVNTHTRTHGRTRQHVKAEYRWKYMLYSWWSTYTTGAEFLSVLYELKSTAMWWCSWRLSVVDGSNPGGRRANHCTMEPHVHLFVFCELQFWLYISDLFKTQKVSLHSGKYDVNWMMSFLTSVFQTYHSAVVGLNTELLCLL